MADDGGTFRTGKFGAEGREVAGEHGRHGWIELAGELVDLGSADFLYRRRDLFLR